MIKAKPGDRIVIKDEAIDKRRVWPGLYPRSDLRGKRFVVVDVPRDNLDDAIAIKTTDTGGVFIKHGDYTILPRPQDHSFDEEKPGLMEVETITKAKPGDWIVFTDPDHIDVYGIGQYQVIECPEVWRNDKRVNTKVWANLDGNVCWISNSIFNVVDDKCRECRGTGRIQLLTSTVECDCVKNGARQGTVCENCSDPLCECDGTCDEAF